MWRELLRGALEDTRGAQTVRGVARDRSQIPAKPRAAIDATGYETRHGSRDTPRGDGAAPATPSPTTS